MSETQETPAVVEPVVEAPTIDADIAEHMRLDDPNGLAPRSALNFVLHEIQKMRSAAKKAV